LNVVFNCVFAERLIIPKSLSTDSQDSLKYQIVIPLMGPGLPSEALQKHFSSEDSFGANLFF